MKDQFIIFKIIIMAVLLIIFANPAFPAQKTVLFPFSIEGSPNDDTFVYFTNTLVKALTDSGWSIAIFPKRENAGSDSDLLHDEADIFRISDSLNARSAISGRITFYNDKCSALISLYNIPRSEPLWFSYQEFSDTLSIQNAVNIIVTEFIKASVNIRARAQENKSKLSPAEDFPFFGVKLKELDNSTAAFLQVPPGTFGVVVKNIARNSPADECGLQAWDIIAEIDGQLIQTIPDFRDILRKYRPLMTLELKIFRSGYEYHYRIKLGAPEKRSGRDWF